jgi:hypothetical protein
MKHTMDDLHLDGNALAGPLAALFGFDVTTARTTCDGCGQVSAFGTLLVYGQEMGAVLRCPCCDHVLVVATQPHGEWCLDLRGVRLVRIQAA